MDVEAYLAAQAELKREKEKQEKLAKLKAEAAKSRGAERKVEEMKSPTMSAQELEVARLRAELAEKDRLLTKGGPAAVSSSSSAREEDLKRELEAVKAKLAADKAKAAAVPSDSAKRTIAMEKELAELRKQLAATSKPDPSESAKREEAMKHEIEELKRTLAASKPSSTAVPSESARREADLLKELEVLRAKETASASRTAAAASTTASDTIRVLRKELEDLKVKAVTPSSASASISASAARVSDLEREKAELMRKLASGPSSAALSTARATARSELDRVNYGVDVCFLVDCTGSMGSFIQAVRTKVMEIIKQICSMEKNAYMRFAFVGYRDHCDGQDRIVKIDFIHDIPGSSFETTLQACRATGGGDAPEDVAGGLEEATTLSWQSSTRLLIHFADAPCHGSQYHAGLGDEYPGGDPHGLIPENLLRVLISKRVDYYFMKITSHTDTMVQKFSEVYNAVGKSFTVASIDAAATDFVPKVVNSISTSMARSFRR